MVILSRTSSNDRSVGSAGYKKKKKNKSSLIALKEKLIFICSSRNFKVCPPYFAFDKGKEEKLFPYYRNFRLLSFSL